MKTSPSAEPEKSKSFFALFIPYAGTLIIVFAVLRLYHYYDYFQVNIFNFISFGEILSLFIESVREPVYVFLAIAIGFILVRLIYVLLFTEDEKTENNTNVAEKPGLIYVSQPGDVRKTDNEKSVAERIGKKDRGEHDTKLFRLMKPFALLVPAVSLMVQNKPFADVVAVISLVLSVLLSVAIVVFYRAQKKRKAVFCTTAADRTPVSICFLYYLQGYCRSNKREKISEYPDSFKR